MQPKNTTVSRNFDGRGGRTTADLSKIQDFGDFRHMVANHDGFVPELTMVKSTENLKIPQILENAGGIAQKGHLFGTSGELLVIQTSCRRILQSFFIKKSLSLEPSKNHVVLGIRVYFFEERPPIECWFL